MDAHSFRILSAALIPLLKGARIDKIYGPLPDLTAFHCFGSIGKFVFAIQTQRQQPRYFLQRSPLPNPQTPSPAVMRLRKYLINAHFGEGVAEITTRSLGLPIVRRGETICWLMCSPSQGTNLHKALPDNFPSPLVWPSPDTLAETLSPRGLEDPSTWIAYPLLTPLLRKTITALPLPEAMALMVDLEAGSDELFFYGPEKNHPTQYLAWPLPETLCKEQRLVPVTAEVGASLATHPVTGEGAVPLTIQLSSLVDEQALHASFTTHMTRDDKQDAKKTLKRARRKERALEQETLRLEKMVERQNDAKLIQENLWRLDPNAKYEKITLSATLSSGETETRTIELDPLLTVRDNMLEIFKRAEKGKRGLGIVAMRQQLHLAEATDNPPLPRSSVSQNVCGREAVQQVSSLQNWTSLIEQIRKHPQKDVAVFTSSDGYTLLRGKNAQGNRHIVKVSKAHDIWLHVQGGPSAHVIIKRHHAQDHVPEQTIVEAAQLVAEKSWLKDNDSAEVMLALVKNVQSIKGAAAGTVKVEKILRTVYVKRENPHKEDEDNPLLT